MRTLDLRQQQVSVADLLQCARTETVYILNEEGEAFILEAADAFEREVAQLGQSDMFMAFLAERAKEPGLRSTRRSRTQVIVSSRGHGSTVMGTRLKHTARLYGCVNGL